MGHHARPVILRGLTQPKFSLDWHLFFISFVHLPSSLLPFFCPATILFLLPFERLSSLNPWSSRTFGQFFVLVVAFRLSPHQSAVVLQSLISSGLFRWICFFTYSAPVASSSSSLFFWLPQHFCFCSHSLSLINCWLIFRPQFNLLFWFSENCCCFPVWLCCFGRTFPLFNHHQCFPHKE